MTNVFNLSLHRSGTQSVHDLFRRAGVPSIHWAAQVDGVDYQGRVEGNETDLEFVAEILEPVIADFVHLSDLPFPALYRQLAGRFPEARFVVLRRSADSWIQSIRRHFGDRPFEPFEKVLYWSYFPERPGSISVLTNTELASFHEWHHASLDAFFAVAENFLSLPLDGPGIGAAICDFCAVPSIPFRQFDYAMGHDVGVDPQLVPARITE